MTAFNTWVETPGCGAMAANLFTDMMPLTIAAANTIPPVEFIPTGGLFMLIVNGVTFTPDDGSFSVSGQNITWNSAIYSVQPGDTVVAVYSYAG